MGVEPTPGADKRATLDVAKWTNLDVVCELSSRIYA